ncbi:hypothetical protein [Indioceanicola profundi]|uniref:hypothetical protein n=1 Tax=Indioceanicola profundi TaxID=2220096 RepID=UPI000E6AAB07|nr:hypothetical protein [Indioceanicola profundi]
MDAAGFGVGVPAGAAEADMGRVAAFMSPVVPAVGPAVLPVIPVLPSEVLAPMLPAVLPSGAKGVSPAAKGAPPEPPSAAGRPRPVGGVVPPRSISGPLPSRAAVPRAVSGVVGAWCG